MFKNKLFTIRIILIILVLILSVIAFTNIANNKIIMPSILAVLGILQIFNGIYFYGKDRKGYGIFLVISGIFLGAIAVRFILM
ncbi:hypothetical protein [Clostridium sp.]|jgi:hypothetical protein|uniref:hypothetical protein n=1 Tax=Clostridium sp. TaxID=1506 RepID=UPI0025865890|nr:hypothetical protein [Clostridium sp.]MDF2505271.1 hypothetical protein [Clostridium sp.]